MKQEADTCCIEGKIVISNDYSGVITAVFLTLWVARYSVVEYCVKRRYNDDKGCFIYSLYNTFQITAREVFTQGLYI